MRTVGEMMKSIETWIHEDVNPDLLLEAISDSIIGLWETMVLINLSEQLGGPAQATFAPASDHANVVSVADPLVAPGVGYVAQGNLAGHAYQVSYTLVTDSGSETMPSPEAAAVTAGNQLGVVTPPAAPQPDGVIGWNCYFDGIRQNDAPIPIGVAFTELEGGPVLGGEKAPTANTTGDDIWYIQSLSVNTGTGEKFWQETEIGSALWKQFASTSAVNTPYQPYVYEFDGSKLNVRPLAASGGVNPSYFYVRRPREIRFPSSTIPFRHPAAVTFIRYNCLSLIHLSIHEYVASQQWEGRAEKERLLIVQSSNKKNTQKIQRIRPVFR